MTKGTCHCGQAGWEFTTDPDRITACNCTSCRRYGVLWAYGWEGDDITLRGEHTTYVRSDLVDEEPGLATHFCPTCGNVICWRALEPNENGHHRAAVNIRLAEPDAFADKPIRHFDGLGKFAEDPGDERCVKDMWY